MLEQHLNRSDKLPWQPTDFIGFRQTIVQSSASSWVSVTFSGSRGKTQSMMLASTQEITGEKNSYENRQFDVVKSKLQQVVHGTQNMSIWVTDQDTYIQSHVTKMKWIALPSTPKKEIKSKPIPTKGWQHLKALSPFRHLLGGPY